MVKALDLALGHRRSAGVIDHSDQIGNCTSPPLAEVATSSGVRPSMGQSATASTLPVRKLFFATLECELLDQRSFKTEVEAASRASISSRAGITRISVTRLIYSSNLRDSRPSAGLESF